MDPPSPKARIPAAAEGPLPRLPERIFRPSPAAAAPGRGERPRRPGGGPPEHRPAQAAASPGRAHPWHNRPRGGDAADIIPAHTSATLLARTRNKALPPKPVRRVRARAEGAALENTDRA